MRIVIIGTGNVATILSIKLQAAGHQIIQVYGRDRSKADQLVGQLHENAGEDKNIAQISAVSDLRELSADADLYIIAVSDSAVAGIASSLQLGEKILVHTAGSVSLEALAGSSSRTGILYPLQSLRKELGHIPRIPWLIDASDLDTLQVIRSVALSISEQVEEADDLKRKQLHLSAVIINNFSNHLYTLASDYCRNENLDFSLLLPLINETSARLTDYRPQEVQTGPAARNDQGTIGKHLALLETHEDLKTLYALMSRMIGEYYHP